MRVSRQGPGGAARAAPSATLPSRRQRQECWGSGSADRGCSQAAVWDGHRCAGRRATQGQFNSRAKAGPPPRLERAHAPPRLTPPHPPPQPPRCSGARPRPRRSPSPPPRVPSLRSLRATPPATLRPCQRLRGAAEAVTRTALTGSTMRAARMGRSSRVAALPHYPTRMSQQGKMGARVQRMRTEKGSMTTRRMRRHRNTSKPTSRQQQGAGWTVPAMRHLSW